MTIAVLKCDECERLAHNMAMEDHVCDWRFFDGRHCKGILRSSTLERVLDPHLECTECERRADKMNMEGKVCQWRLPDGRHCDGILEAVDV
jgi:hypothetical protein